MNKWFLFILSASISLFSTHAARVMLGHYYDSIYYKFEHWGHVAAIGIAEVMFMLS